MLPRGRVTVMQSACRRRTSRRSDGTDPSGAPPGAFRQRAVRKVPSSRDPEMTGAIDPYKSPGSSGQRPGVEGSGDLDKEPSSSGNVEEDGAQTIGRARRRWQGRVRSIRTRDSGASASQPTNQRPSAITQPQATALPPEVLAGTMVEAVGSREIKCCVFI
jgi:hypothetical protein